MVDHYTSTPVNPAMDQNNIRVALKNAPPLPPSDLNGENQQCNANLENVDDEVESH
ncbi:conserved hypothetical protein [Ricinus communis]|uniref:Uncharacterized protein n=1 Tax=Ricinus communis TaxID=3988 RepID=B9RU83_RICCO|nr:conserved hypothetical protein [Ricinus communis]